VGFGGVQRIGLQDEARLVARARDGDRGAFWELSEPEIQKIHRLLVRVSGRAEEAEDLCQEALLRALRSIQDFRGGSRFSTWLYRIALNLALSAKSARREFSRAPELMESQPDGTSAFRASPIPSPAVEAERGSERDALRAAMETLAPRQRAVVTFRIEDELPFAEIADRMDLTVGAVKAHYFQATERLRQAFARPHRGAVR
jgi:RNA polymerase sigma-70 factor (ECF subfamily)